MEIIFSKPYKLIFFNKMIHTSMNYKIFSIPLLIFLLTSFSSCVKRHYPDVYEVPEAALQTATNKTLFAAPFSAGDWPQVYWWLMFDDGQLNNLMDKALADNPDIQIALSRIRLANYAAQAAGSPLWPNLGLEADITRYRVSKTGAIASIASLANSTTPVNPLPPPPIGFPGFTFTQTEINLNGQYQIDFWQQNLNSFKAAVGEVLATEADAAFSTVNLSISIAQAYFNLQVAYAREMVAQKRINNRAEYVQLIEKRVKSGLANQLSLIAAESNLIAAEEALKEIQFSIEIYKNQLHALITGNFLEDINSISIDKQELVLFPLPTNLPLNLLAHRPDVTATAWRVEEAARNIKVAKAAYYPNFNLLALFGLQTIHPNVLFKWRSIYGQGGPAVNLPIFEGGRLQGNLGQANEHYYIAVEQYNQSILNAVQNVLDSMAGLKYAFDELQDYKRIFALSDQSLQLTQRRFKHHIDSNLNVLDADLDTISKEDQELLALGNYYIQFTNLISALGGGYDTGCCP